MSKTEISLKYLNAANNSDTSFSINSSKFRYTEGDDIHLHEPIKISDSNSQTTSTKTDPTKTIETLIGPWGYYIFWICFVPAFIKIPSGMNAIISVFILPNVDFHCQTCLNDGRNGLETNKYDIFLKEKFSPKIEGNQGSKSCQNKIDQCFSVRDVLDEKYSLEHNSVIYNCCFNDTKTEQQKIDLSPCNDNIKTSIELGQEKLTKCQNFIFDQSTYQTTATQDFNFICENSHQKDIASSLFFLGFGIGGLIGGLISDAYGRKNITGLSSLGLAISNIFTSYVPIGAVNYFFICRFLNGFFVNCMMVPAYTLCMELIGGKYRSWMTSWFCGNFAIGIMLLSGFASIWNSWRDLQFYCFYMSVPVVIWTFWQPESYNWLISKSKTEEAYLMAEKCMIKNRTFSGRHEVTLQEKQLLKKAIYEKRDDMMNESSIKKASIISLFNDKRILPITLNLSFNWFVCSAGYYGLALNAGGLPGSTIFNNFMNGFLELPAYLIFPFLMDSKKLGRIGTQGWFLIIGGVCCLLSTWALEMAFSEETVSADCQKSQTARNYETLGRTLAFLGKFCYSGTFTLIFTYTAELFPAEVRSNAVAVGSAAARIAGVTCPFIISLSKVRSWLPGGVFGFFGVSAGVLTFLLPETRGMPLMLSMSETYRHYDFGRDK